MKNAITTSKNSNFLDFTGCNNIVHLFHTTKHKTPPSGDEVKKARDESEMLLMGDHLDNEGHSEFVSTMLFCLAGYIVSKLLDKLTCPGCLLPQPNETSSHNGHDYTATIYHEAGKASCFTNLINKGGLQIPSTSVYRTVEYCEHMFKARVTGKFGHKISNEKNLKKNDC